MLVIVDKHPKQIKLFFGIFGSCYATVGCPSRCWCFYFLVTYAILGDVFVQDTLEVSYKTLSKCLAVLLLILLLISCLLLTHDIYCLIALALFVMPSVL